MTERIVNGTLRSNNLKTADLILREASAGLEMIIHTLRNGTLNKGAQHGLRLLIFNVRDDIDKAVEMIAQD